MDFGRLWNSKKVKAGVAVMLVIAVVSGAYLAFADRTVEISNAEELQSMNNDLDADYVLVDDIDASEIENFEPVGDFRAGEQFTGTFEGNGHTISNLTIRRPNKDGVGLFGYVESERFYNAQIRNVSLEDVNVTGGKRVGGLVGHNNGGVHDSYVAGEVRGERDVGGIVGLNDGGAHDYGPGWVVNSYAESKVSGNENVGGIAGRNDGMVQTSYSAGNVRGNTTVGSLIGRNSGGTVEHLYWDINQTERTISAVGRGNTVGTGLTTSEMTGSAAQENMDGFDFGGTWRTAEDDYPRLYWEMNER